MASFSSRLARRDSRSPAGWKQVKTYRPQEISPARSFVHIPPDPLGGDRLSQRILAYITSGIVQPRIRTPGAFGPGDFPNLARNCEVA